MTTTTKCDYYVIPISDHYPHGFLELRQTRFLGQNNHPHDVCAVARSREEMEAMIARHFTGGVDWSRIEEANANTE